MSSHGDEHAAIGFIKTLFGYTTESVYCCSLANNKGDARQAPERSICDRDAAATTTFLNRWDRDGRGCYVSLSTFKAGSRRQKPNAVETPAFPVDIDFKSILEDEAKVDKVLQTCRCLPSLIVHSGHGRHPWWILKEALPTQEQLERIEAVQRQLADVFAGDLQVAQVVALMRLPGTHNTKGGQWWEVTASADNGLRYELEELEEWLAEQSPLLTRKERPKPPEQNPYLAIAETLGFKPPLDVEERLAAMSYQGAGDAAIHTTQLAVTSSLTSRGVETDAVVAAVLDATRAAAGDYGQRWNWRREEFNIRRMCQTWHGKIERRDAAVGRGEAVGIEQARAARVKPQPAPAPTDSKRKKFHIVAEATLAGLRSRGEELLVEGAVIWHYADHVWTRKADFRQWMQTQVEHVCRQLGVASDTRMINEVRAWLERNPDLWSDGVKWNQHRMVPTRSGLVDPMTFELTPAQPKHHVTWRVDCDYVPNATCPMWLAMLADAFSDRSAEDRAAILATLQEVLGAALIDDKSKGLHKALVLVGGTDCGKSQLLAVMGGLFGEKYIDTPIIAVDTPHGLVPFLERKPWVLDEAFAQNVWHLSATIKTLITGDGISINMKHGPILSHRFTGPIFWGSNHPPQFKENTRAIVDRLVVIKCERKFDKNNPIGIALEARNQGFSEPAPLILVREKAGILTWALQGLKRALARGGIQLPPESVVASAQIYRDSNLVAGFVEDCIEFDVDGRVSVPDFCVAVACWFAEHKGENRSSPSNETIGRALIALHDPRIVSDQYELRDKAARYIVGVKLNSHGLEYHERGVTGDLFEGKTVNTTTPGGLVNKSIPVVWDVKPKVMAMRAAHAWHEKQNCHPDLSVPPSSKTVIDEVSPQVSSQQAVDPSNDPLF